MPYQAWLASCMGTEWYGTRASYDKYRNPFRHLRKRKETIISRKLYTIEMIIIISWRCRVFLFCFSYSVHPSLCLIGPFQVRYKSVVSPFPIMGGKWDLHGICIGITWDLQQRNSRINIKKKNFYITLQLVTHSVVMFYMPMSYSGDLFQNTRHPLITIKWYIMLK